MMSIYARSFMIATWLDREDEAAATPHAEPRRRAWWLPRLTRGRQWS